MNLNSTVVESPSGRRRTGSSVWLGLLASVAMALGVIAVWWQINDRAQQHQHRMMDNAARLDQLLVRHDIASRISALDRLAQRWTTMGGTPRAAWEADAARYIEDMPGFQAIGWADSTLQMRWLVPLAGNEAAIGRKITKTEETLVTVNDAREGDRAVLSEPFQLARGGWGLAVYIPVTREQRFDGVVVGELNLQSWLTTVIGDAQGADHHTRIFISDREVYRRDGSDNPAAASSPASPSSPSLASSANSSQFEAHGLTWTIVISATGSADSAGLADSPLIVLIVGMLLSIFVGVAVYLALVARMRSRQLQDSAVRLETLLKNLPGMAYRCVNDPQQRMEFVSEGCQALSGFSRDDFEEQRVIWEDLIHPDDHDLVVRIKRDAADSDNGYEVEYRIKSASQQEKWMWERGRVVSIEGQNAIRVEGFVSDISRQRAAENEARQHREQLAHMDRIDMLGEMASGIAHEINQPLTAISLFADAGKRLFGLGKQERLPEIFEKLSQHAHRAGAVIERMQSMARKQVRAKSIVDCNALVIEVAKLAEAEARIRDMTVKVETAENLPAVDVDTVQIQQVALNLLRNAMEATQSVNCREGNVVRLRTRRLSDGGVEVAVIDTGCGVSDAISDLLFTPFSTTKDSGLGMGLSISRAIITAHGGQLDFRNNQHGGATFFFTLPAAIEEEQSG